MTLRVGDAATISKTITEDDIQRFADLVGDHNPVHVDDEFAQKTRFGRRIAHGALTLSLISAAIGNHLPGPGTVYLTQTVRFEAPVYPSDTITTKVTVARIQQDKQIVTLKTMCSNQRGETVITGEAVVLAQNLAANLDKR